MRAFHRPSADVAPLKRLGCELVEGDLEDEGAALIPLVSGCTSLVHAAAVTHTTLPWAKVHAINVEGTRKILAAGASAGVQRAVQISSIVVYGDPRGSVDEDSSQDASLSARETYARSKREAEEVAREVTAAAGIPLAVLRPSAVYGERDRMLTPRLIRSLKWPLHPLPGGGDTTLPLVYAGNLAEAAFAALKLANPPGHRAYNVAEDHPLTLRQLLLALAAHLGIRFRPFSVPTSAFLGLAALGDALGLPLPTSDGVPLGRAARLVVRDNPYRSQRVRAELGWKPTVTAEEALSRTAAWIRETDQVSLREGVRKHG